MGFGIRSRLYGGFGCLMLLSAGLGVFSQWQLGDVVAQYDTRGRIERNTRGIFTLNGMTHQVAAQALDYRTNPKSDTLDRLEQTAASMADLSRSVLDNTVAEERRKLYGELHERANAMKSDIRRLGKSATASAAARVRLFQGGDQLTQLTDALLAQVKARGNDVQIKQALSVESAILFVRIANWRFLATADPKGVATFAEKVRKAQAALGTLRELDPNQQFTAAIRDAEGAVAAYADEFDGCATALADVGRVFDEGLYPKIREIDAIGTKARTLAEARMAEMEESTKTGVASAQRTQIALIALVLLIGAASAAWIARSLIRPIAGMTAAMTRLAGGDTSADIPSREAKDEMGEMARAVEVFRRDAVVRLELEAAQVAEQSARQRRADRVDRLVEAFQSNVAQSLEIVTSASTVLDETARSMARVADDTNRQAVASSAAAEETSANVHTVAAAAEEMVSSLHEIERQVVRSNEVASDAAREAEETNVAMAKLGTAADQIGAAVTTISDIASQTNLLALNATIEAARAGEAGRGFAVVAAEVKELASQTARATEEIGGQIATIQSATGLAASAMRRIGLTIGTMNEISAMIASTVTEQTAATSEISRNASEAAHGTQDVSANVARVLASSTDTGGAASRVLGAAAELASQSLVVKQEVDDFLRDIQAA